MLKRERQAYFPYRVNLYCGGLTIGLSRYNTHAGFYVISKNSVNVKSHAADRDVIQIQNALAVASQRIDYSITSKKFFSQQPALTCEFSKINTLITEPSQNDLKRQADLGLQVMYCKLHSEKNI